MGEASVSWVVARARLSVMRRSASCGRSPPQSRILPRPGREFRRAVGRGMFGEMFVKWSGQEGFRGAGGGVIRLDGSTRRDPAYSEDLVSTWEPASERTQVGRGWRVEGRGCRSR
jgi:hypothetical protein